VTVVDVAWHGSNVVELVYKDAAGRVGNELLLRDQEAGIGVVTTGRPWSFDGDGGMLRLVSEAQRIGWAYLFDPLLAIHTSLLEPLPHQITALYGEMLPREPLKRLCYQYYAFVGLDRYTRTRRRASLSAWRIRP